MRPCVPRQPSRLVRAVALHRAAAFALCACSASSRQPAPNESNTASVADITAAPGERHLRNVRQLTFGGENAEAYFSHDGKRLIFQSTRDGRSCDQQYVMNVDGSGLKRLSNGKGKTTCGYYMDGDRRIFYASTFGTDTTCPPKPDPSKGYVR